MTRLPPRPRVLLADDHTRLREALRDLLEETGFEVVGESGDGADAVAMARQLEPDIVVIDLRMPVLNGLDATRLIKDGRSATQVVVLSAFESPELERQAREAGAFAYLDKGRWPAGSTGSCWARPCRRCWPPTSAPRARSPGPASRGPGQRPPTGARGWC